MPGPYPANIPGSCDLHSEQSESSRHDWPFTLAGGEDQSGAPCLYIRELISGIKNWSSRSFIKQFRQCDDSVQSVDTPGSNAGFPTVRRRVRSASRAVRLQSNGAVPYGSVRRLKALPTADIE